MGRRIQMPQRKNFEAELLKDGGTVVGGVIGGIYGGPGGAAGGAMLGRNVGSVAGGVLSPDRPPPPAVGGGQVASSVKQQRPGLLDTAAGAAGAYQGIDNFREDLKSDPDPGFAAGNVPQSSTPMQRRMSAYDNANALADADAALERMPPDYQQQYGPTIKQARYLEAQKRGMA